MKSVVIIPARYASQRLPGKALADIHGKPMVQHVYERAARARLISDVFVAADNPAVESAVIKFGGKVIMTPTTIQSGSDRVALAAKMIDADIIINVQGDEPLIAPGLIDEVVHLLIDDSSVHVGTAVKKISSVEELSNPNIVKVVMDKQNVALYFSRSIIPFVRDLPLPKTWLTQCNFYKHFGIYGYRAEFLQTFTLLPQSTLEQLEKLEQLRILENGYRIKVAITDFESVSVDTSEDLERVRKLMSEI